MNRRRPGARVDARAGRVVPPHVATADCERCRPGPIAQPVNTVSSLAFCVAGGVLVARARPRAAPGGASGPEPDRVDAPTGASRPTSDATSSTTAPTGASSTPAATAAERALGWSAVAAGLGSVAYHGPGTRAGRVLHDASLLTMLGALVVADLTRATGRPAPRTVLAALPGAATVAAASRWSLGAQIGAGVTAAVAEIARVRADASSGAGSWRPAAEVAVATVGAVGHLLGRTGGPLCRPDSRWQAHAAWHTAMATVLVLRD